MTSVCMAAYNGERFIKEQIDSILCQLSPDDELIISDDESTDRTLEIIASYNDKRIKVLHHKKNPKLAKVKHSRNFYYATENFENALKEARGDYIFLSDQDDVWKKNKVQVCLEQLQKSDLVMHNLSVFSDDTNSSSDLYKSNPIPKFWLKNLLKMNFWGCCMAFRKTVLDLALPFPKKIIGHDYWISTIALKFLKVGYIPESLIYYRRHKDSVSHNSTNPFWFRIYFRFKLFLEVLKRKESTK